MSAKRDKADFNSTEAAFTMIEHTLIEVQHAHIRFAALCNVLLKKKVISAEELDVAIKEGEAGAAVDWALNPINEAITGLKETIERISEGDKDPRLREKGLSLLQRIEEIRRRQGDKQADDGV
jgi:hypothetical protein